MSEFLYNMMVTGLVAVGGALYLVGLVASIVVGYIGYRSHLVRAVAVMLTGAVLVALGCCVTIKHEGLATVVSWLIGVAIAVAVGWVAVPLVSMQGKRTRAAEARAQQRQ